MCNYITKFSSQGPVQAGVEISTLLQLAGTWVQNVVMQSVQPRVEIIHKLFKHVWLSTIYYKKTTWRLRSCFFYFQKSMPGNVQHFNPRVEIVHVIANNFKPVNRAEFNPRVESAPLMPSADNAEQISLKAKD